VSNKTTTLEVPASLEKFVCDCIDLVTAVNQKRLILRGAQSASAAFTTFSSTVLKATITTTSHDISYTFLTNSVEHTAPQIDVQLSEATEAELIAAKKAAPRAQHADLDRMISLVQHAKQPSSPVRPEIKARPKILTLTRDGSGRLSGAVIS